MLIRNNGKHFNLDLCTSTRHCLRTHSECWQIKVKCELMPPPSCLHCYVCRSFARISFHFWFDTIPLVLEAMRDRILHIYSARWRRESLWFSSAKRDRKRKIKKIPVTDNYFIAVHFFHTHSRRDIGWLVRSTVRMCRCRWIWLRWRNITSNKTAISFAHTYIQTHISIIRYLFGAFEWIWVRSAFAADTSADHSPCFVFLIIEQPISINLMEATVQTFEPSEHSMLIIIITITVCRSKKAKSNFFSVDIMDVLSDAASRRTLTTQLCSTKIQYIVFWYFTWCGVWLQPLFILIFYFPFLTFFDQRQWSIIEFRKVGTDCGI